MNRILVFLQLLIYLDMNKNKTIYGIYFIVVVVELLLTGYECQTLAKKKSIHEDLIGISHRGTWKPLNNSFSLLGVPDYTPGSKNHTPYNPGSVDTFGPERQPQQKASSDGMHNFITFLKSGQGFAEFLITQTQQKQPKPYIYIQISNSAYINSRVVQLSFVLEKGYDVKKDQWKTGKFFVPVRLFQNFKQKVTFDIGINFQMKRNDDQVVITLKSQSLGVVLQTKPVFYGISYFVELTFMNIIQIVLLLYFGKNTAILANTSEWLVLHSCLFLIAESIFIFKLALAYYDTYLSYLFFNFVLNLSVMMLILWKFSPVIEKFRQRLHFLSFIVFSIVYFKLVYDYYINGEFWIFESMIFLWQIVYSISRGGTGGVSMELVIVVVLSRIPLLDIMKTEQNIFKLKPNNLAANIIIVAILIHLVIIYLQRRKGSRFFVPVCLIPDYFNYMRYTTFGTQVAAKQCSICINKIREKPNTPAKSERDQQRQIQQRKNQRVDYVMTQCSHYFHQSCLNDWLNVHLVCPNCKKTLPPMNLGVGAS